MATRSEKYTALMLEQTGMELYRMMKRIRMVEESIADRYHEQEMRCPVHLCVGQEAVPSAAGFVLGDTDFCVSTHRSHGHYLGKGGNLKRMIAELYGKSTGCSSGKGGSMHLIDQEVGFMGSTAIVASTIPVGVGLGLSLQLKQSDNVSAVFFGDGATEEGVFYESLNFAALKKLPVLFVCENNLYSVYSPLSVRQPFMRKIYKIAESMGVKSDYGDGNNALEVYERIKDAVDYIRSGSGPYFLEFATYRWREHCGPNYDNNIGYRTQEEFLFWKEKDPVENLHKLLVEKGILDKAQDAKIDAEIQSEIEEAFKFAKSSPFPDIEEINTDIFV